jgi:Fe-S cluster assembly protein SufD
MTAFPTRKDEAWRYSDLAALERIWPLQAPENVVVPANGALERTIVQDAPAGETAVHQLALSLGKGARARLDILNLGGAFGRIEIDATLHEGADFALNAVQVGGGSQVLEIVTNVRHAEPNATSRQTVRSVLAGKAIGTYLGKVAVDRVAQKTDAEQSVRAMLLDRTATANAKPELEIYADDVKCAHGAAVGELDANGLFYLQSRGLPPAEARKLMLQAFVAGAFDGAEQEEQLQAAALAKLGALA